MDVIKFDIDKYYNYMTKNKIMNIEKIYTNEFFETLKNNINSIVSTMKKETEEFELMQNVDKKYLKVYKDKWEDLDEKVDIIKEEILYNLKQFEYLKGMCEFSE